MVRGVEHTPYFTGKKCASSMLDKNPKIAHATLNLSQADLQILRVTL